MMRKGYAMILMLVSMLVLSSITFVVVSASTRDQQSSRLSSARSEARAQANSALEDFYSRIVTDPEFSQDIMLAQQEPGRRLKYATLYPALSFSTVSATSEIPSDSWSGSKLPIMGLTDSFAPLSSPFGQEPCPTDASKYNFDCYVVKVESSLDVITVTATSRVRCAGNYLKCVTVSLTQRLRKVQYYDFLVSQEYATVDSTGLAPIGSPDYNATVSQITGLTPESSSPQMYDSQCADKKFSIRTSVCMSIAYLGSSIAPDISDKIAGPLYSYDDYIPVCGNPTSSGSSAFTSVTLSGTGYNNTWYNQLCNSGPVTNPTYVSLNYPSLKLPSISGYVPVSTSGTSTATVVNIASPAVMRFNADGKVEVFENNDMQQARSIPYNNTVFVVNDQNSAKRDVSVQGVIKGKVSVVSQGDAAVTGDLKYSCASIDVTCQDFFSLTAVNQVEVWQECNGAASFACLPAQVSCPPQADPCIELPTNTDPSSRVYSRTIHGILVSLKSFVGTPDWYTNINDICPLSAEPVTPPPPSQSCRPTLKFTGSMTSKYQGVFGAYDSSNGQLVGGFYKDFTHDPRLVEQGKYSSILPPYTVSSLQAVWSRVDVVETSTK